MKIKLNSKEYTYKPENPQSKVDNDFIGRGRCGRVYKAYSESDQKYMAMKKFYDNLDEASFSEVQKEVTALQMINHENVISISNFGWGQEGENCFICLVMPYIDGWDLEKYWDDLKKNPRKSDAIGVELSSPMIILWKKLSAFVQICNGIQHVHDKPIYHRDLKPQNIRIDKDGHAYILDFGIAKVLANPDIKLTLTLTPKGTPYYMSPEHWEDPLSVDHRCDIWSLGVIFYQSLTGKLPFSGTTSDLQKWICTTDPEPIEINMVEESLQKIWLKALQKKREHRYQQAKDMAQDLLAWLREKFLEAVRKTGNQDIESVSYSRLSDPKSWREKVEQYKGCAQLPPPILAPAVGWYGGDDIVPQEVCLAWPKPKGKPLKEAQLSAKQWEALVEAIEKAVAHANAKGFPCPLLPSAEYIFVNGTEIRILGIRWPYEGVGTLANAPGVSKLLLDHLADIPDSLREMLNLRYEEKHTIAALRECLKKAPELEEMYDHLQHGPGDKAMLAAQKLIQWKISSSELLRAKANELWELVERLEDRIPAVVEITDQNPGWVEYSCTNDSGEKKTYWIRLQESADVEQKSAAIVQESGDVVFEDVAQESIFEDVAQELAAIAQESADMAQESAAIAQGSADVAQESAAIAQESSDVAQESAAIVQKSADVAQESAAIAQESSDVARESAAIVQKSADVAQESAAIVQKSAIIVAKKSPVVAEKKILTFGLPEDIWADCNYEHEGTHILDMSTPTWQKLSVEYQGKYARQYQIGYVEASQQGLIQFKGLELEIVIDKDRANIPLILIPPGRFLMGSPANEVGRDPDETQHLAVITKPYYIGKTPVTQGQWQAVVSSEQWPSELNMKSNPSYFQKAGLSAPVECVNHHQCDAFCKKLDGKLSTEAEFEFATRSGVTRMTYAGDFKIEGTCDAPGLDPIAWYSGNSGVSYEGGWDSSDWPKKQVPHTRAGTHPVAQKQPNHYGLYDTIGNVWEWCQDYYGDYPTSQVIDYKGVKSSAYRVLRGGSLDYYARSCRASNRFYYGPGERYGGIGFRFSRPIP